MPETKTVKQDLYIRVRYKDENDFGWFIGYLKDWIDGHKSICPNVEYIQYPAPFSKQSVVFTKDRSNTRRNIKALR